jgi:hypothetical protein
MRAKRVAAPEEGLTVARAARMCAHRYEDLDIWQLANELKEKTYELIDKTPAPPDACTSAQPRAEVGPRPFLLTKAAK